MLVLCAEINEKMESFLIFLGICVYGTNLIHTVCFGVWGAKLILADSFLQMRDAAIVFYLMLRDFII